MELSLPRGVKDEGPKEAMAKKQMQAIVEEVYKRFGFYPIKTPHLETMATLTSKSYGEEAAKQIYALSDEKSGLRYDLTVPLARFLGMNKDLPMPFKRYCIGTVWRKDEPQKMRAREFMQADVDIVGSSEPSSDAEVVAAAAFALEELGFENYKILINNRAILNSMLLASGFKKESLNAAVRIIDKLDKLSTAEVVEELSKFNVPKNKCEELISSLQEKGANEEKLAKAENAYPNTKSEVQRTRDLLKLLEQYHLKALVEVDLSLARGIDYYTSLIWEFVLFKNGKRLPSVCAGGRYDDLLKMYSGTAMPATGASIGLTRLFDAISGNFKNLPIFEKVYVAYLKSDDMLYALNTANLLRAQGIYTDLNVTSRNLAKQLAYANSQEFSYVLIIGAQERNENKVRLRNMVSGKEEVVTVNEAIRIIKGE